MPAEPGKITVLLKAWSGGDIAARDEVIPAVYNELRRLANHYRRSANGGETLQTTALVHEAYLRLVDIDNVTWQDRGHFFALSAQLMRRILVDAARARRAAKRGGATVAERVNLDDFPALDAQRAGELLALDDALDALNHMDCRRGAVVELRIFAGLSVEETADALNRSPRSVMRDWRLAKAWLLRELSEGVAPIID